MSKRGHRGGGRKIGEGGKKDIDGRKGREEAADEVIERVKRDSELDEHEQRPLDCIVDPRKSILLSVDFHCSPTL